MAKLPLNGLLQSVNNPTPINDAGFLKQEIVLMIPGYVDEYGEKKGKDEHWCIAILGDNIDKFNLHQRHIGQKVKTEVFINSREFTNKNNEVFYNINVNLSKLEFVNPQAAAQATGEKDDLPF